MTENTKVKNENGSEQPGYDKEFLLIMELFEKHPENFPWIIANYFSLLGNENSLMILYNVICHKMHLNRYQTDAQETYEEYLEGHEREWAHYKETMSEKEFQKKLAFYNYGDCDGDSSPQTKEEFNKFWKEIFDFDKALYDMQDIFEKYGLPKQKTEARKNDNRKY